MQELRIARSRAGMTLMELEAASGVGASTISKIERSVTQPQAGTLHKLAEALGVEVDELYPKDRARPPELLLSGAKVAQRAAWEAAVDRARGLRETGEARMRKALAGWSASYERGEPYATRHEYREEMGGLLQEAYGAYQALGEAYIQAALTQGGDEASVPSYLKEESGAAFDFYVDMFGLVRSRGLTIRTDADAAAAKHAVQDQPEARSYSVLEPKAA